MARAESIWSLASGPQAGGPSLIAPGTGVSCGGYSSTGVISMSFYQRRILPHVINLSMRNRELLPYRQRVLEKAEGRILEIGIGSGINLPYYPRSAREIVALEPAPQLIAMARPIARQQPSSVEFIEGSAEAIPLDRHSIDTVVTTWTLCSIPE